MARLGYSERKGMAKKDFAVPSQKTKDNPAGKGAYPIPDKAHGRNALSRVSQFGSPTEKAEVRTKVHAKFPDIGQKRKKGERETGKGTRYEFGK